MLNENAVKIELDIPEEEIKLLIEEKEEIIILPIEEKKESIKLPEPPVLIIKDGKFEIVEEIKPEISEIILPQEQSKNDKQKKNK